MKKVYIAPVVNVIPLECNPIMDYVVSNYDEKDEKVVGDSEEP